MNGVVVGDDAPRNPQTSPGKVTDSPADALDGLFDGAVVMVGGFGNAGVPVRLLEQVAASGVRDLTLVANNCGTGDTGIAALFANDQIRRVYASFPSQPGADHFHAAYARGAVELILVPQGTLAERMRAAGAGIAGFYTPTGADTALASSRETRLFEGRPHLLEVPLRGDFGLVRAQRGDPLGNLRYRRAARNFNPLVAMAAAVTIAEVNELAPVGAIDPDDVHTPGIWVDRVLAPEVS